MKKEEDDLRPEYDLSQLLERGVRGKYAERYKEGTNVVLLEPDVAEAFLNAAQLHGHKCPSCGGEVELAGKGVVRYPFCGAEVFLTG
jgi:hypothetical protein